MRAATPTPATPAQRPVYAPVYVPTNDVSGTLEYPDTGVGYHVEVVGTTTIYLERYASQRSASEPYGYVVELEPASCTCREFGHTGTCRHLAAVLPLRAQGAL